METNEIMENEEVVETTEEIVKTSSGKGLKVLGGLGFAMLVGLVGYKYVAKPMIAKIKAKKDEVPVEDGVIEADFEEIGVESEEETE